MTTSIHRMAPLYEAKMAHQFDSRWATYEETDSIEDAGERRGGADFVPTPRYWISAAVLEDRLASRWGRGWLMGWRRIARSTDVRTVICPAVPRVGCTDKLVLNFSEHPIESLLVVYNSFVFDYLARQKAGGTQLDYYVLYQLPVPSPAGLSAELPGVGPPASVFRPRLLELTYTAWDMQPFAQDLDDHAPPFRWDEERRAVLRAELDAVCFHLYGIEDRDDVDYILGTFPIVSRKDVAKHGEERTRRLVLESYDAMTEARRTGVPFRSTLTPPPGEGPRHEPRTET